MDFWPSSRVHWATENSRNVNNSKLAGKAFGSLCRKVNHTLCLVLRSEPAPGTSGMTAHFCSLTAAIVMPVAVLCVVCVGLLVCYKRSR